MVCTWLQANQKWKALHVTSRLAVAERAKVRSLSPAGRHVPEQQGTVPGTWAQHQGESTAQLRARPLPTNLPSCQQLNTSWNNLPAYCTWISSWRTRTIAGCKDQRLILQQTSLGICLGVHWLWILGEDYGIALMISYLTCFTYGLSVFEFGWRYIYMEVCIYI